MSVELTSGAAKHVADYISKHSGQEAAAIGIRLAVRKVGCSGFAYDVTLTENKEVGDLEFNSHGVRVIIDPKSLVFVDGVVVDYVKNGVQEGFQFNNPNAKSICGCGESFHV